MLHRDTEAEADEEEGDAEEEEEKDAEEGTWKRNDIERDVKGFLIQRFVFKRALLFRKHAYTQTYLIGGREGGINYNPEYLS